MRHKWLAQGLIEGMDRDHLGELLELHGKEAVEEAESIARATGGDADEIAATILEVHERKKELDRAEDPDANRILRDRFNNPIIVPTGNRKKRRELAARSRRAKKKKRKRDMR